MLQLTSTSAHQSRARTAASAPTMLTRTRAHARTATPETTAKVRHRTPPVHIDHLDNKLNSYFFNVHGSCCRLIFFSSVNDVIDIYEKMSLHVGATTHCFS